MIPVAGKPIVYRLVEGLAAVCDEKIDEIAFVVGDFGKAVEESLVAMAEKAGAKGSIYYQDEPLGTAHAILCAAPALDGHVIVAFADTLFYADFRINTGEDGIIWTSKIDDPSSFGVVEKDQDGIVKQFWEKPKEFISDEAIIGIYYFRDGVYLRQELQSLVDTNHIVNGEYQLTDALTNMKNKGYKFKTASVSHWLDCGNKDATVATNKVVLEMSKPERPGDLEMESSIILDPSYIGKGVVIRNSIVGPFVSIGDNCVIGCSVVSNSIIMNNARVLNANLEGAMNGNYSVYEGKKESVNLGDYSEVK